MNFLTNNLARVTIRFRLRTCRRPKNDFSQILDLCSYANVSDHLRLKQLYIEGTRN